MSGDRGALSAFTQPSEEQLDELLQLVRSGLVELHPVSDGQRVGLMVQYNETEVDRRLGLLERAGVDPAVLAELRTFHERRRQAEQQLKEVRQNGEKEKDSKA